MKSIIYYTDNLLEDPIRSMARQYIEEAGLPIASASLKPIDFGDNQVIQGKRGYATMVRQIVSCLERSLGEYVFFCEHDVFYPKSHFDFTPPVDDVFYYNANTWRWEWGSDRVIRHDRMLSQSVLCADRDFALDHYKRRLKHILDRGYDKITEGEPKWARIMGYEPGTKKKKRGGFSDDNYDTWESEIPVIDVRHEGTFSQPKLTLANFKHLPKWFTNKSIDLVEGWDLREYYNPR